jgi:hypothetical protein
LIEIAALKECFTTIDINIDDALLDYLLYVIYSKSESADKMKYQVLFDLIEGKLV